MKKLEDVCVMVQARLGSQRVPQKMIRPFAGTTLMDICLEKLANSQVIPNKNVYASVYEPELVDICKKYDVEIYHRSEASANSEGTPMTQMYEWWIKHLCIVFCNACAPFLNIETVENFVKAYLKQILMVFLCDWKKNYYWDYKTNW